MNTLRGSQLLIGLRDFESAARCGSFAAAGTELGVSASAVSQQVKSLEARLDVTLFERKPQSLVLTLPGRKLLSSLSSAFELIESSLTALKPPQDTITLSMPATFAANWFLPRMRNFRLNYPRFEVIPRSSGNFLEPGLIGVSAAIRHGRAGWGALDCRFLFAETFSPICSPTYLNDMGSIGEKSHRLLVAEDKPELWDEWTRATGSKIFTRGITVLGDELLVAQAAMNDHGVALLDRNLMSKQLSSNNLIALTSFPEWRPGDGWYIVFDEVRSSEEALTALFDWLIQESSA